MLAGAKRIFETPTLAAHAAADAFLALLEAHDPARGLFNVALSGGSTPNAMYDYFAAPPVAQRAATLARKARYFWSDERTVPPTDPDSNFGNAWSRWLKELKLPAENIHRLAGEHLPSLEAAAYARLIGAFVPPASGPKGDADARPCFDLVFLGMGPDAHTASLFPGTAALTETERLVVANPVPQHQTTRLTFTFPLINAARAVWILCTGSSKTAALTAVANTPAPGVNDHPISRIRPQARTNRPAVTWWLDQAAAGSK